jgi:hypothetical protein
MANLSESQARQKKSDTRSEAKATLVTYRPGLSSRSGHQGSEDCNEERKLGHDDDEDEDD